MRKYLHRFRTLYQFGFAALIILAIVVQFVYGAATIGKISIGYVGLFVSYFTILSNILVAVVLCVEASNNMSGAVPSSRFELLRAFATFCIITTGITYTFFLRGPAAQGVMENSIPWINDIFHHIMPLIMTFDWIAFPTKKPIRWRWIPAWIGLTGVYAVYVELLGLFTHEYPYFFLDPVRLNGYLGVGRASLGFIPFFLVFGAAVVFANHIRLRFSSRVR